MCCYLAYKYKTSFLLSVKENGLSIVNQTENFAVAGMWNNAQVTIYHQQKIYKCLCAIFISKVIITEKKYVV